MFTYSDVLKERRRGRKSRGRMGLGSVGCVGAKDREGDCVPEKSEERYVACVSRVLGCSATGTLSENLSSCAYGLQSPQEEAQCNLPSFYESAVARVGRTDTRKQE